MPASSSVASPALSGRSSAHRGVEHLADTQVGSRRLAAAARAEGRSADRRQAGRRPALGKYAKVAATAGQGHSKDPDRAREARAQRFWARRELAKITGLRRVGRCGRVSVIEGGEVQLRATETDSGFRAGFGGLETCGSIWSCTVCSAKISARRAAELEKIVRWNADRGGSIALATFTISHHKGHRLRTLRRALQKAWRHITGSRAWKEGRKGYGLDHYVRAIECTLTEENGWHLHVHALMFFDGPISSEMVEHLADELYELWSDGLALNGFTASRKHGVDVRVGSDAIDGMGKYLSKVTFEVAGGRFKKKRGTKAGRTPFEVLHDGLTTGNADDLEAWFEWEQASKGMIQLYPSRGLKAAAGVEDVKDEEIAAENEGGEIICVLPARTWRHVYLWAEQLLTATELGGPDAALGWLARQGFEYETRDTW